VIVIGLDGLDPRVAESMLSRGELPHLAKLRATGGFSRVATTTPAQTPVAWSTFATGVNPGGHGIFDFLRRDPKTYRLDVALNRYEQPNAFSAPKAVNLRKGTTVWERLSAAGISSSIVRCPCTYPPGPLEGRLLSGMGVPDLRGGFGTSTFYTSADDAGHGESEQVVRVAKDLVHGVGEVGDAGAGVDDIDDHRVGGHRRIDEDRASTSSSTKVEDEHVDAGAAGFTTGIDLRVDGGLTAAPRFVPDLV